MSSISMTPRDVMSTSIPNGSAEQNWKILFANWVFHQGVSTVLLFFLVAAMIYVIPKEIEKNREDVKAHRETMAMSIVKDQENRKQEHVEIENLIRDLTKSIEQAHIDQFRKNSQ